MLNRACSEFLWSRQRRFFLEVNGTVSPLEASLPHRRDGCRSTINAFPLLISVNRTLAKSRLCGNHGNGSVRGVELWQIIFIFCVAADLFPSSYN